MPFPFDRDPVTLWALTGEEKLASCEVRFVPIGVEGRVLRNGKLLYARTFPTGDETFEWAEDERKEHLAKGWRVAAPATR